jgi:hypothetical protein
MLGDVCSLRYLQLQVVVSLGSWVLSPVDVGRIHAEAGMAISCRAACCLQGEVYAARQGHK